MQPRYGNGKENRAANRDGAIRGILIMLLAAGGADLVWGHRVGIAVLMWLLAYGLFKDA